MGAGNLLQSWAVSHCKVQQILERGATLLAKWDRYLKVGQVLQSWVVHRSNVHVGGSQKNLLSSPIPFGLRTNGGTCVLTGPMRFEGI